ncbi:MAG TPA: nucleotide exchange factor GrpE [Solirubrobacteraceae bacterium]|nr:nucleotide exchange factor GrpE [Solirubrobacteraceae bacterium]
MSNSKNNHHATEGRADLPQAPPGAPEGHDAAPGGPPGTPFGAEDEPLISAREPAPQSDPASGGSDGDGGTGPRATSDAAAPAAATGDAASAGAATPAPADAAASVPDPASLSRDELQALVERAAKADEYLGLAQRKQAEFENFRKRAAREATAAQERGATKLAKELLPAVDNLERALQHAPDDGDEHGFVAGVKHVHADLLAALQRAGIEQFSPQGERFDPTLHEAVAQTPSEGTDPGTVIEVYQRGYRVGETVVRPARVIVAA